MKIITIFFTLIFLSVSVFASSSYTLKMSDVFQGCDFVHEDSYSIHSISSAIQASLNAKLDSDKGCDASYNQLNTNFNLINSLMDESVSPTMAQDIYDETYSSYLVTLIQEASTLDLANPSQQVRYDSLISQIGSLKTQLYDNKYNLELNKQTYNSDISTNFKKNLFGYAKSFFSTLNNLPDVCVDNLGGWEQMVPALLKVGAMIGSTMGPTGAIVGAGLEAASELTVLLHNKGLKKAVTKITTRRNEQILACTYLSLQTTACDLQRAKVFSENKEKVKKIIFRDLDNSKYEEYERFYIALNTLPRINSILSSIGAMGSAVTLDVDLITKYFQSIKIRPDEIIIPADTESESVIKKFLLNLKNSGLSIMEFNPSSGEPYSVREQFESAKVQIHLAKTTIESVISILQEKRSFLDLLSELTIKSTNVKKEIVFVKDFLEKYRSKSDFPQQYIGLFVAAQRMADSLIDFFGVSMEGKTYDEYVAAVDMRGGELFKAMSYGSVAQITTQTALMIPSIAFERFSRPFKALENYYLNKDIVLQDDPNHVFFSDYMINDSLQVKVVNDYKYLTGSKVSFRLGEYETTRRSFEQGFKDEIKKMIKNAMKSKSEVLQSFEGKTAAHMCALFSPFLKENSQKLYKKCQENYKTLELLSVLDDFKKKTSLDIDYNNACFYSNYKREEMGQRMLFDRLVDYGSSAH